MTAAYNRIWDSILKPSKEFARRKRLKRKRNWHRGNSFKALKVGKERRDEK